MSGLTGRLSTRGNIDKPVYVALSTGDIEIGAVEIKNSTDDTRAVVNSSNALQVAAIGNVTLSDPKGFIGLVTVGGGTVAATFTGNVTLDSGSKTQIVGNLTLSDAKGFIGLVTVVQSSTARSIVGNLTLDAGSKVAISGNVTLSDAKTFIGLVTIGGMSQITLSDPKGFIGLVTVVQSNTARSITGNITITDSKGFIGLVTVGNTIATTWSGNVTLDAGSKTQIVGNVTLSDPKGFIGLVTLGGGTAWTDPKTYIGLITVGHTVTVGAHGITGNLTLDAGSKVAISGNVTLSDAKTFIGLVTLGGGTAWTDPKAFIGLVTIVPTYLSTYTSLSTTISATGAATLVVPPSNQTIFLKNLLITSLGRAEVNISSPTVPIVPYTALATTGGFAEFYGEGGLQFPAQNTALVVNLNGAATIGVRAIVRFV